jgi:hypothetical protein
MPSARTDGAGCSFLLDCLSFWSQPPPQRYPQNPRREITMRSHVTLAAAVATFLVVSAVAAQSQGGGSVPTEIGNRVNGLDYRPTPSGVVPREKVAGIRRPATDERATDETLERIDKELLGEEGVSTHSVPKMWSGS